jgi:hypothetical protein
MKTVLIYVNTSKEVGDVDHLKVFANEEAMEKWFEERTTRRASPFSTRCWSERIGQHTILASRDAGRLAF